MAAAWGRVGTGGHRWGLLPHKLELCPLGISRYFRQSPSYSVTVVNPSKADGCGPVAGSACGACDS